SSTATLVRHSGPGNYQSDQCQSHHDRNQAFFRKPWRGIVYSAEGEKRHEDAGYSPETECDDPRDSKSRKSPKRGLIKNDVCAEHYCEPFRHKNLLVSPDEFYPSRVNQLH